METQKTRAPRSRERGKGKHNKGTTRIFLAVSCQPQERDRIKAMAKEAGMQISAFVLSKVFN